MRGHRSSRPFRATAILPCPVFPPRRPFLAPLSRRADASTAPSTVADILQRGTQPGHAEEGETEPGALQQQVLRLFRAAAELVPAFKSFLAEAGVEPKKIVSIEDFRKVPLVVMYTHT